MPQRRNTQKTYNEGSLQLALLAIKQGEIDSKSRVAAAYNAPRSTIQARCAGALSRRDCEPNSKKLTKLEEEVIVRYILDLDSRGFSPSLGAVRDMANKLLAERSAGQVGEKWPRNFVNWTASLKTRWNRPYDRQRALCEDPKTIKA